MSKSKPKTNLDLVYRLFQSNDFKEAIKGIVGKDIKAKKFLSDFSAAETLKYRNTTSSKPVLHIGQLKLYLTEMEFLNDILKSIDDSALVVYAGSAPSMHLPFLLELYPNVKFILVDPNEHVFHFAGKRSHYDLHNDKKKSDMFVYLRSSGDDRYKYKNRLINMVDTAGKDNIITYKKEKGVTFPAAEDRIYDSKLAKVAINLLTKGNYRVVVIEDLFGPELAAMVKEVAEGLKLTEKFYFWSDIRTASSHEDMMEFVARINNIKIEDMPVEKDKNAFFDDSFNPLEIDILFNCAQQYNWLRIMRPEMSMLKFRAPFPDEKQKKLNEFFSKLIPYKGDLTEAKAAGIDFIADFNKGIFRYMKADRICLQAYAGRTSTESRLYVNRAGIDIIETYDVNNYEDRFFYYNLIERGYGWHNHPVITDPKNKNFVLGFDHCGDCALFYKIFDDYKQKAAKDTKFSNKNFDTAAEIKKLMHYIGRSLVSNSDYHGSFMSEYKSFQRLINTWISHIVTYEFEKIID